MEWKIVSDKSVIWNSKYFQVFVFKCEYYNLIAIPPTLFVGRTFKLKRYLNSELKVHFLTFKYGVIVKLQLFSIEWRR